MMMQYERGGGGGGENVSKSDDVILVRSLVFALSCYVSHFDLLFLDLANIPFCFY